MYRAIALAAIRRHTDLQDARALLYVARHARIEFDWSAHPPGLHLNGEPVAHMLRAGDTTQAASYVAVVPAIREMLVSQQRRIALDRGKRRHRRARSGHRGFSTCGIENLSRCRPPRAGTAAGVAQLRARGEIVDFNAILNDIVTRDRRDATRAVGPLAIPPDASIIDTTRLAEPQVVNTIVAKVDAFRVPAGSEN